MGLVFLSTCSERALTSAPALSGTVLVFVSRFQASAGLRVLLSQGWSQCPPPCYRYVVPFLLICCDICSPVLKFISSDRCCPFLLGRWHRRSTGRSSCGDRLSNWGVTENGQVPTAPLEKSPQFSIFGLYSGFWLLNVCLATSILGACLGKRTEVGMRHHNVPSSHFCREPHLHPSRAWHLGTGSCRGSVSPEEQFLLGQEGRGPRLCWAGTYLVFSQIYQFSFLQASAGLHFQSCLALQFLSLGVCRPRGLEC